MKSGLLTSLPVVAPALLLGSLTILLAFENGGYFAGSTAVAALSLLAVVALRIILVPAPFAGLSRSVAIAAGLLGAFAFWTLLSGQWSESEGRALFEADRALLYGLVVVLFGSFGADPRRLRLMVVALVAALIGVCAIAFVSRVLPDVWPIDASEQAGRLAYPVNYWNGLGLMASLGVVLCAGLTSDLRAGRAVRVLSAAATPLLVSVLLLTASRAAVATGALGLIVLVVLGRPRALVPGLAAIVPTSILAGVLTVGAELLLSSTPVSAAARDQGDDLAAGVALCVLAAALARLMLLRFDASVWGFRLGGNAPRSPLAIAAAGALLLLVIPTIAFDVPSRVQGRAERFLRPDPSQGSGPGTNSFARLTSSANNGRVELWRASLKTFLETPLRGSGAGTFELDWQRKRPLDSRQSSALEGHSLYLEVLAELGVVGFLLLTGVIVTIVAGLARRIRGAERVLYATVFAAALGWSFAVGVDWHLEVPAVSLWFFALGATAMARTKSGIGPARSILHGITRVSAPVACCALLAAGPVRVAIAQHELDDAVAAYRQGDCARTARAAVASVQALRRAEPYELLAQCAWRTGRSDRALQRLRQAIDSDPHNWRPYYGLAFTKAAAGEDPGPAIAAARALNPHEEQITEAIQYFSGDRPSAWRRGARRAAVPVSPPS